MQNHVTVSISIILPIYNMETWIVKSIDSIEQQTLSGIELIIIDDGSTDASYKLVTEQSKYYENIRIVKTENKGSGPARNIGIEMAKGEYIAFMDADDFYKSNDSLEYLYKTAIKNDALICGGMPEYFCDGVFSSPPLREMQLDIGTECFVSAKKFYSPGPYWCYIYKRKFLMDNEIRFPSYVRGQDNVFFLQVLSLAGKAFRTSKCVYVYRKNHKKILWTERKALDIVKTYRDTLKISIEKDLPNMVPSVESGMNGFVGALLLHFCIQGNAEMLSLLEEINALFAELNKYDILPQSRNAATATQKKNIAEMDSFLARCRSNGAVIYGAGIWGKRFLAFLREQEIEPKAFLVSNKSKNPASVEGIPVFGLEEEENILSCNPEIVVAIVEKKQRMEIINVLDKAGINVNHTLNPLSLCLWSWDNGNPIES